MRYVSTEEEEEPHGSGHLADALADAADAPQEAPQEAPVDASDLQAFLDAEWESAQQGDGW